jgi:hypothetical protein
MSTISQPTQKLIQRYQTWHQSLQRREEIATIHVDEVASKVAAFYEKIRGVVDWKEEHLFRKTAIERMAKRRLIFRRNGENVATPLVYELIRGGHFPNDKIPESKIEEIQRTINKYLYILDNAPPSTKENLTIRFQDWLLEIAACEIEETLDPPVKEKALTEYATELLNERVVIRRGIVSIGKDITEQEKNIQIYIAVQRSLFNFDIPLISYHLLSKRYPNWHNLTQSELEEIAKNIYSIRENLEKDLNHPLADKFYKVCERYDTPYLILGDILSENPMGAEEKLSQPEALENSIRQAYNRRAATLKSRLGRAAFYATLSIFLTNIVSLYVIEIPLSKFVLGHFSPLAIAIDIFVPTLLMFILISTVRLPKKENLEVVVMEVMKIVYEEKKKDVYEIRIYPKRNIVITGLITILYVLAFLVFAGLVVWGLEQINLPATSHIIFIIFISLITFAGTKIRRRAKELQVIEAKENFFYFILDVFAIPITQLGKWLSSRWKKYNAIAKFFSYLIDMPFQIFVEFIEQWRYFLKEKKEEIH